MRMYIPQLGSWLFETDETESNDVKGPCTIICHPRLYHSSQRDRDTETDREIERDRERYREIER